MHCWYISIIKEKIIIFISPVLQDKPHNTFFNFLL